MLLKNKNTPLSASPRPYLPSPYPSPYLPASLLPVVPSSSRCLRHFHQPMIRIFIEQPSTESLFLHRDQLKKVLEDRNISIPPTRTQADLIIIFISNKDTEMRYLNQVMSLSGENKMTIILVPNHGQGKKTDSMDFLKRVDGWVFGCRLPKKVPTPMIIGGDFPGILKNITTVIGVRWRFLGNLFSSTQIFRRRRKTSGEKMDT